MILIMIVGLCSCCKQHDLIVEMNGLLNVILFEQTSPAHSERKSSAESLVRFVLIKDCMPCILNIIAR